MKSSKKYFLASIMVLLLNPLISHQLTRLMGNLTSECVPILNGYIHSLMSVGILIFLLGIVKLILEEKS